MCNWEGKNNFTRISTISVRHVSLQRCAHSTHILLELLPMSSVLTNVHILFTSCLKLIQISPMSSVLTNEHVPPMCILDMLCAKSSCAHCFSICAFYTSP